MRGFNLLLLAGSVLLARPDVIECDNGDRYNGKVLSMDEQQVKLQNEITGTLTIPRSRIVSISFRPAPKAGQLSGSSTNGAALRPPGQRGALDFDGAAVEQVQRELLSTANPEANRMFQEMVRGLQAGQLNIGDIRAQAQQSLKQLRELQEGLGDDEAAGLLESYASILENFVRQAPTNPPPVRPVPPAQPAPKQP